MSLLTTPITIQQITHVLLVLVKMGAIVLYDNDSASDPDPATITLATEIVNNKPHANIQIDNSLQDDYWNKILIEIKSTSGTIHAWEYNGGLGIVNFTDLDIPGVSDGDTNFTVGEIGGYIELNN